MLTITIKQGGWNISFPFVSKDRVLTELNEIHDVYVAVANKSTLPFKKLQQFDYSIKSDSKIYEEGSIFLRKRQFVVDGEVSIIEVCNAQ
jgi:hypothetical protein